VTFLMKTIITLRVVAMIGNVLYLTYGIHAELGNIILLHGALLPMNAFRLSQSVALRRKLHRMAHTEFDPKPLLSLMVRETKSAGDMIFARGDIANDMYYLVEGRMHIDELDLDLEPGQMIGEIALFTPSKARTQTIRCIEPCTLMRMTEEKVFQLYAENPEFGLYVTKMMVARLVSNSDGLKGLQAA